MKTKYAAPIAWATIIVIALFSRIVVSPSGVRLRGAIDLQVYAHGGMTFLRGLPLYAASFGESGNGLPFTYPPFAAFLFSTFAWLPFPVVVTLYLCACLACLWAIARWLALPVPTAVVTALFLCAHPTFNTLSFGQINIFLMTLILADAFDKRPAWLPRGVLIGIAAAIKVTPGIFLLWFLVRRDFRGLLGMLAGGAAATLGMAVWKPRDTWTYFTEALVDPNRVGNPAYIYNAALKGDLLRLGAPDAVWYLALVVSLALGVWAAYRAHRCGQPVLSLVFIAAIGLLVSPISWTHHWTWLPVLALLAIKSAAAVGVRQDVFKVLAALTFFLLIFVFPLAAPLPWLESIVVASFAVLCLAYFVVTLRLFPKVAPV
ncbi:glycosyltransferase 87 family protein [Corynebacterium sp. H128]|uniref:glycosyltransferase 87 family protein n=1 Tax=unclassified Corynebacterium TaxID=2624378 RepID=UPI0030B7D0A1